MATPTPTPTPTPSPSPTAFPTPPPPTATPTPLPATIVVNAAGGDDFTSIQLAFDTAVAGSVIKVKNGTYGCLNTGNRAGTSNNPIWVENYPGHSPVIACGTCPSCRVELNSEYVYMRGFEIAGGWNCVRIQDDNIKFLNNNCHNSLWGGILVVPADEEVGNIEIAYNTSEVAGYVQSGTCTNGNVASSCTPHNNSGDTSAKHRHEIYISNAPCNGVNGVWVHHNTLRNTGGRAFQLNGLTGGSGAVCAGIGLTGIIFEDNTISNTSWGVALFYGNSGNVFRNNTFTLNTRPSTNDTSHTFFGIYGIENTEISGNSFNSTNSGVTPYHFEDTSSGCPSNVFDDNMWDLNTNGWVWGGSNRNDFSTNFNSLSGCGADDTIN